MIPADSNSWYFSFANSIDPTYWDIVSPVTCSIQNSSIGSSVEC